MDSKPGRIFLLKKSPQGLKALESFFTQHHWEFSSGHTLKEFLVALMKNHFDYILMPADHPHKKVKVLPGLIHRHFNCEVIGYLEINSPQGIRELENFPVQYRVFPPLLGNTVEREILKCHRETKSHESHPEDLEQARQKSIESLKKDNFAFEILQEKETPPVVAESEDIVQTGIAHEKGELFLQKGEASGQTDSVTQEGTTQQKGELYLQKGQAAGPTDSITQEGMGGRKGDVFLQKGEGLEDPDSVVQKGNRGELHKYDPNHDVDPNHVSHTHLKGQGKEPQHTHLKGKGKGVSANGRDAFEDPDAKVFHLHSKDPSAAQSKMSHVTGMKRKKKNFSEAEDPADAESAAAVEDFSEKTNDVLADVVDNGSSRAETALLSEVHEVVCMTVRHRVFEGYLVAASSEPLSELDFYTKVKAKLSEIFTTLGSGAQDDFEIDAPLELKLEPVSFKSWARTHAEFLQRAAHQGTEIALAFFPSQNTQVKVVGADNKNMLAIDLSELKEDTRMEFDVFLHLPGNEKYILYTPEGQVLQATQKGRLQQRGVSSFHIRKESMHQVKKYKAKNFLNSLVREFKNKKAA